MDSKTDNRIITRRERAKRRQERKLSCQEEERIHYPKKRCPVGTRYQCSVLPTAGSHNAEPHASECYSELIWSKDKAEAAGLTDFVHNVVTHNKKEAGMVCLHKRGYRISGFFEDLMTAGSLDGSAWSREEKECFHRLILSTRKEMRKVAKSMGKSMNECLAYYFNAYKFTADYVALKRVMAKERGRQENQSSPGVNSCELCDGGGELICCGGCEKLYHLKCIIPPIDSIPKGEWHCDHCRRKRSMAFDDLHEKRKRLSGTKEEAIKPSQQSFPSDFNFGRRLSERLVKPGVEVVVS